MIAVQSQVLPQEPPIPDDVYGLLVHLVYQVRRVHGVEVFGRLADEKKGNLVEVIFVVTDAAFQAFATLCRNHAMLKNSVHDCTYRIIAMEKVLGKHVGTVFRNLRADGYELGDVYLFPANWRERLVEIKDSLGLPVTADLLNHLKNNAKLLSMDGPPNDTW